MIKFSKQYRGICAHRLLLQCVFWGASPIKWQRSIHAPWKLGCVCWHKLTCLLFFVPRSRGACDTYKQFLSDALNQLKALHKAGVLSNNQSGQFDRLLKAVDQIRSRPIWTPNTSRQQQADLIEQLKKELNKVMVMILKVAGWAELCKLKSKFK